MKAVWAFLESDVGFALVVAAVACATVALAVLLRAMEDRAGYKYCPKCRRLGGLDDDECPKCGHVLREAR